MDSAGDTSLLILVVDDEPAMVGAVSALVGRAGHRVVTAYDGNSALRRFSEERPDLVLLDLAMPGLDGVEVCRAIRRMSQTPIIVLTGEADERAKVEALDTGPTYVSSRSASRNCWRGSERSCAAAATTRSLAAWASCAGDRSSSTVAATPPEYPERNSS
jgi:Response regulators consisting of a CheY-like receiver domain and a winged-helix DNA-binding domain